MSRCKSWVAIVVILTIATALAAVAVPQKAAAATTKSKLRSAKMALRHSRDRLQSAETALTAAEAVEAASPTTLVDTSASPSPSAMVVEPSASPSPTPSAAATPKVPTVEELRAKVVKARRAVRLWKQRVARLARQYRLEQNLIRWEQQHQWMKIIEVAAAKYHVKAGGMYRMMMRESGGQRFAGSSTAFKGLYQYWTGTWSRSWNPWRNDSIYDGSSQIFATAYAIHKGMGPSMWTTTYASQY